MQRAIQQFENNIDTVKQLSTIYTTININLRIPLDLSDLLRSQLVHTVSALDKLIHELVRIGMVQAFLDQRIKTKKFNNFSISMETYKNIQKLDNNRQGLLQLLMPVHFFEQEIVNKHKHLAFQDPDKIADALSLIWEEPCKWKKISLAFNKPEDFVRKQLKSIISRRNQIVHEADIYLQPNIRNNINEIDVTEVIHFISKLGQQIFLLCR